MADWTTLPDQEPGDPGLATWANAARDNPIAIAEGAEGAPRIQTAGINDNAVTQAKIANGAVGQSELKTTTGSVSGSGNQTLPGGSYCFLPAVGGSNGSDTPQLIGHVLLQPGESLSQAVRVAPSRDRSDLVASATVRYIQSSPPYDHGDGVVQGYEYAALDANGRVVSMYLAEDPPWYGNTQHTPMAQWRDPKTGKEYQRTRKLKCCKRDVDEGRISMAEFIERAGECEDVVEEITPEVKLRGMDQLPHPFDQKPDCTIVLLDPMDEKIARLIRMMQAGENVHELFREGYLTVDNEPCKRCGPPGVPVHEVKWRKT